MIIKAHISNQFSSVKNMSISHSVDHLETKECNDSGSDTTLYNFGYATKEVIEKFQHFCYQYSTLTEAIQSLLKRDKLLKYKYRFKSSPVTYQMLAKPTVYDQPNLVKSSMCLLNKYMKQNRYKSVADAVEELLFAIEEHKNTCNVGVNTAEDFDYNYTSISMIEQEALSKIADAVLIKLDNFDNSPARKKTKKSEASSKELNLKTRSPKEKKHESPKEKKHRSPKENVKCSKSTSPAKNKSKDKKLTDPDYDPDGKKCLWNKFSIDSPCDNKVNSMFSLSTHNQTIPVDVEMITPLKKLMKKKYPKKTTLSLQHLDSFKFQKSKKEKYMLQYLGLRPHIAMESSYN